MTWTVFDIERQGREKRRQRAIRRNPILESMKMNTLEAYGQGMKRSERRRALACIAQRNLMEEEMRLNILGDYGQGIGQRVQKFSSMVTRWRHRLHRRYRRMKSVKKRREGGECENV